MPLSFFQRIQKRNRDFEVTLDDRVLPVRVVENDRAKRLTLRLAPGGDALKVTVPSHVGDSEIEAFVARNRNWAAVRLARLPQPNRLEAGATIPFRGVDHEIQPSGKLRGVVEAVEIYGRPVILVPGAPEAISRKCVSFFKATARQELDAAVSRHASSLGVRPKRIRITDTSSRWGSCSSTRTLSFSWRIILAPPEVLDYLAAHEVAHLVEMNHSDRFWELTRQLCPETDRHKAWLRTNGARLHAVAT